jgi:cathepsin A (carboxypeptidase C)
LLNETSPSPPNQANVLEVSFCKINVSAMLLPFAVALTVVVLLPPSTAQKIAPVAAYRIKKVSLCGLKETQYSGYIDISPTESFFFYFAESRGCPRIDPIVLYLNGGPGGSSIVSAFGENGPCRLNLTTGSLYRASNSWNNHASMLYLDQPFGTGFSKSDYNVTSTEFAAKRAVSFLRSFLHRFDHLASNDLYLAGASYAGFFIPAIAEELLQNNAEAGRVRIHLKGISLGNPWLDARAAYTSLHEYACVGNPYRLLANESTCNVLASTIVPYCLNSVDECYRGNFQNQTTCAAAYLFCEDMASVFDLDVFPYDVRRGGSLPDVAPLEKYFNLPETKKIFGAEKGVVFAVQSTTVIEAFAQAFDGLRPIGATSIPRLLDAGVRVLIFNGDADAVCPYIVPAKFISTTNWSGRDGFARTPSLSWTGPKGEGLAKLGTIRSYGGLSVVRVFQAGHVAPLNQPAGVLGLFNAFLKNRVKSLAHGA